MKPVTECKKRVRTLIKKHGYRKTTLNETNQTSTKVYYEFGGSLNVIENFNLSFHFGRDDLFGCTAHICCSGVDIATHYIIAEDIFTRYLNDELTEQDILNYVEE